MSPDRLKIEISSNFQVVKERSTSEELMIICPVPGCGDLTGNRSINLKTQRTNCWRCSRTTQPRHVKSLFRLLGIDLEDNAILEPDELRTILAEKPEKALTPIQEVPLPSGFLPLIENRKSCYWKFCKNMAERKHLGIEDLEEAGAGFTREGEWEPFCIFPVREGPRTVYYQGRTYSDEGFDKTKKFPSKKIVPYGASYWIYGLDALRTPSIELVIIVESILNYLSLKRKLREGNLLEYAMPICVFTHFITRSQVFKMLRYKHVKEWCLLFDSDSTHLAEETALNLNSIMPMTVAAMPPGINPDGTARTTNDANDDVIAGLTAVHNRSKPTARKVKINLAETDHGRRVAAHSGNKL